MSAKEYVPATVGVPLRNHAVPDPLTVNPVGSVPNVFVHVYGGVPPVAFSGQEYETVVVPFGHVNVVMTGGAATMVMLSGAVAVLDNESVTRIVKL